MSPLAVGELLLGQIPGARLEVIAGGTHAFGHERPEEVAGIIGSFLSA